MYLDGWLKDSFKAFSEDRLSAAFYQLSNIFSCSSHSRPTDLI